MLQGPAHGAAWRALCLQHGDMCQRRMRGLQCRDELIDILIDILINALDQAKRLV